VSSAQLTLASMYRLFVFWAFGSGIVLFIAVIYHTAVCYGFDMSQQPSRSDAKLIDAATTDPIPAPSTVEPVDIGWYELNTVN
jgi:hypothetical protein